MDRILVGLDASPRAEAVLDTAIALARRVGGKLVLFRAAGLPMQFEIPAEAYAVTPEDLPKLLRAEAEKNLKSLAQRVPPEHLDKVLVSIDTPWEGVCEAAKNENVSLIMVGTHGYAGLDRLLGTTAAKIVNHAHCSVMVVRHPEKLGL